MGPVIDSVQFYSRLKLYCLASNMNANQIRSNHCHELKDRNDIGYQDSLLFQLIVNRF